MPEQDIDTLIAAYLEGALTPPQAEQFSAWLTASPDHARYVAELGLLERGLNRQLLAQESSDLFAELAAMEEDAEVAQPVDLTSRLRHEAREARHKAAREAGRSLFTGVSSPKRWAIPAPAVWLGIAAAFGLVVWLGWQGTTRGPKPDRLTEEGAPEMLATRVGLVRSTAGARWNRSVRDSVYLQEGVELQLDAGVAELVLGGGSSVIVEAPATIVPLGPGSLRLVQGSITVHTDSTATLPVTIETTHGSLTHRSGEFGIRVHRAGTLEAHAFSGTLAIVESDGRAEPLDIRSGVALTITPSGRRLQDTASPLSFVGAEEFQARYSAGEDPYDRWLAYSYELRRDPALVAFFVPDPETVSLRRLRNLANHEAAVDDASVFSLELTGGRFRQRQSLGFSRLESSARFDCEVPMRSMTVAAWLWIDEVPGPFAGIVMSDRWTQQPGAVHWQIERDRTAPSFGYRVMHGNGSNKVVAGRSVPTHRWVHLVTVVDGETGRVQTYIDGRRIDQQSMPMTEDLVLGRTRVGNWQDTVNIGDRRRFSGRMDELIVLCRAMSSHEVDRLYEQTRHTVGGR